MQHYQPHTEQSLRSPAVSERGGDPCAGVGSSLDPWEVSAAVDSRPPTLLSRSRTPEKGATMVEFAISASIFFIFIISALEIMRFGYTNLAIQFALTRVARFAIIQPLPLPPGRVGDIRQKFIDDMSAFGVNAAGTFKFCPVPAGSVGPSFTCPNAMTPGLPKDLMLFEYQGPFYAFVPVLSININRKAFMKNEPYIVD